MSNAFIPRDYSLREQDLIPEDAPTRRDRIRRELEPSDVMATVLDLLRATPDDTQYPIYALVQHCTAIGTEKETGVRPHMEERVGALFAPWINQAIELLIDDKLAEESLED